MLEKIDDEPADPEGEDEDPEQDLETNKVENEQENENENEVESEEENEEEENEEGPFANGDLEDQDMKLQPAHRRHWMCSPPSNSSSPCYEHSCIWKKWRSLLGRTQWFMSVSLLSNSSLENCPKLYFFSCTSGNAGLAEGDDKTEG